MEMMKVLLWLLTASISSSYRFRFSSPLSHFRPLSVGADWEVERLAVAPRTTDDKRDVFDEYYSACMVASENDADRGDIFRRSNHLGRTLLAGMKRPHVRDEAWR